jgi:oligoribonuclease NrnB/cAMP/cGMP phosphodiesterase (DHH superfamily)
MITILYHRDADGCTAALAARFYFSTFANPEIQYISVQYGEDHPYITGNDVYILDFSYPRDVLEKMYREAKSLIVIDHHVSAERILDGLPYCYFDKTKSGAVMAWEYFFPQHDIPLFFLYVQDRDLWKFDLPHSREFSAGVQTTPLTIDEYEHIFEESISDIIQRGETILAYQENQIQSIIEQGYNIIQMCGHRVPCINHTDIKTASEVCNRLSKGFPFAAIYFDDLIKKKRVFSLRSTSDGIDVSRIAQIFGGGGHTHAAGFSIDISTSSIENFFRLFILYPLTTYHLYIEHELNDQDE